MTLLRALVSCAAHRGFDCRPYATKYELVINLKTGKTLLDIRLLALADEAIE
jgi:hypothetical protein